MIWIAVTTCLLLSGLAAAWFSPLRPYLMKMLPERCLCLLQSFPAFDRYKFICHVEQYSDESQPVRQDQFFRVQIFGRIPTEQDNVDTHVQVEILDVTEGLNHSQQILSTDDQFRQNEGAEFYWVKHNGLVPEKNAVLARWVTVVQFPCHVLRFAYRGRRKLLFRATVLNAESGLAIVTAQQTVEYVYCSDGYREVHGRRLEVLQASIELAAMVFGPGPYPDGIEALWSDWIQQKADMIISADEVSGVVKNVQNRLPGVTMQNSSDIILAYGKNTDRFFAAELALRTTAFGGIASKDSLEKLFQMAQSLEIQQDRFLGLAQKILLSSHCKIEDPSQLLGITTDMDDGSFRKQLNEEYRKWNARVTHPDAQIRAQADRILTLIAEIRSQWLRSAC